LKENLSDCRARFWDGSIFSIEGTGERPLSIIPHKSKSYLFIGLSLRGKIPNPGRPTPDKQPTRCPPNQHDVPDPKDQEHQRDNMDYWYLSGYPKISGSHPAMPGNRKSRSFMVKTPIWGTHPMTMISRIPVIAQKLFIPFPVVFQNLRNSGGHSVGKILISAI
jgi:hypothetical protein